MGRWSSSATIASARHERLTQLGLGCISLGDDRGCHNNGQELSTGKRSV